MFRTRLLARCALAACLTPALPAAMAQTYPAKPITLVVPHSAGGTSDILARTVAAEAAKTLGQTIVIDNKGGANGTIAAKQVASSAPDGYTLLLATASTHGINPSLYSRISYDAIKDFTPVTLLATVPNVLVVGPNVKAGNVQELIAFIRSQGDKTNMGSAGAGTPGHLAGEMFKSEAKLQFTHVPYKGGSPAITDLIGGQIDFMFTTIPGVLPHVKAGSLRALAVTSPERSSAMPDVPTMAESGLPGFQAVSWHGIVAPAGTPDAVVARLNQALTGALAAPEVKQRLMEEGARASGVNTAEFGKFIQTEMAAWAKAVKDSGATAN
ncbi:MAG: extra-cytoplasmic solute receptor family protein [Achromobacter mucicolens]|jgi:tripartite-type tricarboxylate transporter receptor subunit TctC|uniref:Bug family tripartite tricarboxylate transporter substrate binding protein n=1 Tax=Achromobacter TaxID=222 RepID=UPI00114FD46E|nr:MULTISPECIES: tripartite tricarboxylate transporter substrate binding protein [Achromobacter]MDF2861967.1 extra-cytoplasmic solute receptor family protein [Achromobacter mucicolens]TQJ96218.1 tripartite-type tricarboxylate transporter receptor subunit TctC [Achromobacter sp. SLBN-14]